VQFIERSPEVEMEIGAELVKQIIDDLLPDPGPRPSYELRLDPDSVKRDPTVSSFVLLGKDIRVNGFVHLCDGDADQ
jgi:hypothetical protein